MNLISIINVLKISIFRLKIAFCSIDKTDSELALRVIERLMEHNLMISNIEIRNLILKYDVNEEENFKRILVTNKRLKSFILEIPQPFFNTIIPGIQYWEYPINLSILLISVFKKKIEFKKFNKYLYMKILSFFRYKKDKIIKIAYRN